MPLILTRDNAARQKNDKKTNEKLKKEYEKSENQILSLSIDKDAREKTIVDLSSKVKDLNKTISILSSNNSNGPNVPGVVKKTIEEGGYSNFVGRKIQIKVEFADTIFCDLRIMSHKFIEPLFIRLDVGKFSTVPTSSGNYDVILESSNTNECELELYPTPK